MKVYHASNVVVSAPDITHSREALDFGRGFYVTELREQAVKYAEKFKFRGKPAVLNIYELDDAWREARIKRFDTYDEAWLDFVAANRKGLPVETYEAVEGGIANDKVFRTLGLYFSGDIRKADALGRLKFEHPNHQICLLSQELINKYLKFIKAEEL